MTCTLLEKKQFVNAVYVLAMADTYYGSASLKSVQRMNIQIGNVLKNKALRKPVISAIVGFSIGSTKNLTQVHVSALIEETLEHKSDHIIESIEEDVRQGFAQNPFGFKPWDLYTRQG